MEQTTPLINSPGSKIKTLDSKQKQKLIWIQINDYFTDYASGNTVILPSSKNVVA
jgi:hypothetical protein